MNPKETSGINYVWEKQITGWRSERIQEAIDYCKTRCNHTVYVEFIPPSGLRVYTYSKDMMHKIMHEFKNIGVIVSKATEQKHYNNGNHNKNLSLEYRLIKEQERKQSVSPIKLLN